MAAHLPSQPPPQPENIDATQQTARPAAAAAAAAAAEPLPPMTARMAALPPEQRERAFEAVMQSTTLYSTVSTHSAAAVAGQLHGLVPDIVSQQLRPHKSGLAIAAEALLVANGAASMALSVWMIVELARASAPVVSGWRFRVLAGSSLLVDVVAHVLLIVEIAVHLSRRVRCLVPPPFSCQYSHARLFQRSRAGNLKFLGPSSVGEVWRSSSATLVISLLFCLLGACTIGSMWQPVLLPASMLIALPLLVFYIHTPFSVSAINLASSTVAHNAQGFLTPNACCTIESSFSGPTTVTPLCCPEFLRFSEIADVQIGTSATTFHFYSRQDERGRPALLKRSALTQQLFYAMFSIAETSSDTTKRRIVGFLISPDLSLYCIRPNSLFGCQHRTFRDLLITVREHAKPEVLPAVQRTLLLFDRIREDLVVRTTGAVACCC